MNIKKQNKVKKGKKNGSVDDAPNVCSVGRRRSPDRGCGRGGTDGPRDTCEPITPKCKSAGTNVGTRDGVSARSERRARSQQVRVLMPVVFRVSSRGERGREKALAVHQDGLGHGPQRVQTALKPAGPRLKPRRVGEVTKQKKER